MMRIALLALIAMLAGCAAQAAGPGASVDVSALVRSHPLYGTLAQYDRQIAVLRSTLHVPEFARKSDAFAHAADGARSTLAQTASRTQRIAALPTPDVRPLQANDNVNAPSESRVRSDMQQAYGAQASQLHAAAHQAMERYRAQLLDQQRTALANYEREMQARVQQAYASREQQLYEKESTLALDLAKADAGKRLAIRAKLQTLQLMPERRHALQAEMDAIQSREDAQVAKQHRHDRAILAAFLPPLQARANADVARMRGTLQQRTAANLAARERVLAAQNAQHMRLNLGASAQPASNATDMNGRLNSLLAANAADPQAFTRAGDDLARQFADVRNADDDATHSTWAELAALNTARAQLYDDIVSQIMNEAKAVARSRGLAGVYALKSAPPGSVNITSDVRSDIEELAR